MRCLRKNGNWQVAGGRVESRVSFFNTKRFRLTYSSINSWVFVYQIFYMTTIGHSNRRETVVVLLDNCSISMKWMLEKIENDSVVYLFFLRGKDRISFNQVDGLVVLFQNFG